MIGRTISHYRILGPLGSGGMGVVYLAEDARLGRQVALKFLPVSWSQEAKALERFRIEARAASSLSHPSICAIYDIGQDGETPFIVMEALKGETLRERIMKGGLRVADVLDIGIQLADALGAAHAQGIVHRDIKPANIFLGDKNRVKVLDFGLAKLMALPSSRSSQSDTTSPGDPHLDNQITQPGTALGTVSYMSPEQARGEEIDGRSDLFSLGAVLYEMVTGNQAFGGATTAVIYEAILNRAPRPIADLNPLIPPRLEVVIGTALEKDRDLRYQHAADLEAEMKRIRRDLDSGTLITSRSMLTSARESATSSARSAPQPATGVTRRWDKAAVVIAVLAVIIAGALVWRGQNSAGDRSATPVAEAPASSTQPPAPVTALPPIETAPAPAQDSRAASPPPVSPPAASAPPASAPAVSGAAQPRGRVTTPPEPTPTPRSSLPEPPAVTATPTPPPQVSSPPATPPATPSPAAEEVRREPTPAPAPTPAPPPPASVQPATPLPRAAAAPEPAPPAASTVETDDAAIRRVIRIYEQAIETKNITLFRSVRPNLTRAAETVVVNSFRQVDSQEIDIRVEALEIDGRRATARLARRDTLTTAGRRQVQNSTQTLRFEKTEAGWIISE